MTTIAPTRTLADGFYTVRVGSSHRTFRVRTNDPDSNFAPGKQVIAYLSGPDNGTDYTQFAFVGDGRIFPWRRFQTSGYDTIIAAARYLVQSNHEEAGKFYAMQSGCCYRCGKLLTTPESVAAGLGPTCRNK